MEIVNGFKVNYLGDSHVVVDLEEFLSIGFMYCFNSGFSNYLIIKDESAIGFIKENSGVVSGLCVTKGRLKGSRVGFEGGFWIYSEDLVSYGSFGEDSWYSINKFPELRITLYNDNNSNLKNIRVESTKEVMR